MKTILSYLAGLLLLLGYAARAQATGIAGIISDTWGKPVADATIIVELAGKSKGTARSDKQGNYAFATLSPAAGYTVKVSKPGYAAQQRTSVVVKAGKTTEVNFTLLLVVKDVPAVAATEDLKVKEIQATKRKLTSEEVSRLATRNTTSMANLAPGVSQPKEGGALSIAGARSDKAVYIIDGGPVRGSRDIQYYNPSTESYKKTAENDFMSVKSNPLSTFSIDVDNAGYSNVRRFVNMGQPVPPDAVRIEEMVNYFHYQYPQPKGPHPISITSEIAPCPWNAKHQLLHIGLQGKEIDKEMLPPSNLVFLIDVSGSMNAGNKLPLLKSAFSLLVQNLRPQDRVAIVTYAGRAGLVLPSTSGSEKGTILAALDRLSAGGSTAGGEGIQLAYQVAKQNFLSSGNNRVILATDGDFNVGVSNNNELEDLIVSKRKENIFLTCLGFGMGNYKDDKMELLADKGNGNYAYIDNIQEARKTLVSEFGGTLFTIARDVKAQIEFNPARVKGYRLIGYENRMLNTEDFKDDKKDAGDMGAGHTVTMLYEIIPVGVESSELRGSDGLKYQKTVATVNSDSREWATVKFRYKQPAGDKSVELSSPVTDRPDRLGMTSDNFRFSASVALWGMLLKDSEYKGNGNYRMVLNLGEQALGNDEDGYRSEYIRLVKSAQPLEKHLVAEER